jgi:hypothetical protein
VALAKFAVPGVCWQGDFLDTEGNTFGIFQPDANAASEPTGYASGRVEAGMKSV